jgi:repressor LexA
MTQPDEHGARILSFVERYQTQHRRSPTYREIGAAVGISSTDHVSRDLRRLACDGFISFKPRVSKSIVLLKTTPPRRQQNALPLPYFNPSEQARPDELTRLASELFQEETDTFLLRARGQSMRDAVLDDGDLVVVKRTDKFQDGDLLAVYLRNQRRTTLRHIYRENGRLRVQSVNPDSQPQYYKPAELEIRGTVLAILRKRETASSAQS